jgi:hypothetical protein
MLKDTKKTKENKENKENKQRHSPNCIPHWLAAMECTEYLRREHWT